MGVLDFPAEAFQDGEWRECVVRRLCVKQTAAAVVRCRGAQKSVRVPLSLLRPRARPQDDGVSESQREEQHREDRDALARQLGLAPEQLPAEHDEEFRVRRNPGGKLGAGKPTALMRLTMQRFDIRESDIRRTPPVVFDAMRTLSGLPWEEGSFYDPCPLPPVPYGYDGLTAAWDGPAMCNPPFSQLARWMRKCRQEHARGVSVMAVVSAPFRATGDYDWINSDEGAAALKRHRSMTIRQVVFESPAGGGSLVNVVLIWMDAATPWMDAATPAAAAVAPPPEGPAERPAEGPAPAPAPAPAPTNADAAADAAAAPDGPARPSASAAAAEAADAAAAAAQGDGEAAIRLRQLVQSEPNGGSRCFLVVGIGNDDVVPERMRVPADIKLARVARNRRFSEAYRSGMVLCWAGGGEVDLRKSPRELGLRLGDHHEPGLSHHLVFRHPREAEDRRRALTAAVRQVAGSLRRLPEEAAAAGEPAEPAQPPGPKRRRSDGVTSGEAARESMPPPPQRMRRGAQRAAPR
eukprot:TRINITY_DN16961_c1_g1_i2.p1 TRINITY_DN16961_c1_g1~~TRINITY_DN16961_c1_g1_i2.p1  ORF type:complete len:521 (+),score=137.27 TRINITY_DN16961_c1_g1_i2:77-1639(+)